jgi:hypothetical protein
MPKRARFSAWNQTDKPSSSCLASLRWRRNPEASSHFLPARTSQVRPTGSVLQVCQNPVKISLISCAGIPRCAEPRLNAILTFPHGENLRSAQFEVASPVICKRLRSRGNVPHPTQRLTVFPQTATLRPATAVRSGNPLPLRVAIIPDASTCGCSPSRWFRLPRTSP